MARGGRIEITVDYAEVVKALEASVARVGRGTRKATVAACEEIGKISKGMVPEMTGTLSSSFGYEIHGAYRNFEAILGYGMNGDPINPETGQRASQYMVAVHEDLTAHHNKGKAKFLEDAIREYQRQFLPNMAQAIREELG